MQQRLSIALLAAPAHLGPAGRRRAGATWTWRRSTKRRSRSPRGCEARRRLQPVHVALGFLITTLPRLRNRTSMVLPRRAATPISPPCSIARPDGRRRRLPSPSAGVRGRARRGACRCRPGVEAGGGDDDELAWQPAWDDVAVLLHTSGSTGDPQAQPKTLLHLATGGVLAARLASEIDGGFGAVERIVCSVPAQHMFGLECSVMLPLVHGTPVLDRRPLLPADVVAAFAEARAPRWIATPMHLRSGSSGPSRGPPAAS
jgi:hypothetical protein